MPTHSWRRRIGDAPLEVADLEMLAAAASLAGDDAASTDAWVRAHQEYVRAGDPARAVRCRVLARPRSHAAG